LIFEPVVPLRILVAGWIALPVLALLYAFWRAPAEGRARRLLLAVAHAAPLLALLFILHGPTWLTVEAREGGKPPLLVLIDRSASMAAEAENRAAGSRHEKAVRLILESLPAWSRSFTPRLAEFDRTVRAIAPVSLSPPAAPDGAMTDISLAIQEGFAGGATSCMLLLSDGIHNGAGDPLEAARQARALGCPIYTVTLGSEAAVEDIGIVLAENEGLTFVRQPYRALVTLTHRGLEDVEVILSVRKGTAIVEERAVPIRGPGDIGIDLLLAEEKPGLHEFTISVAERPGEIFRSNNQRRLRLRVVDERVRVLVLEGKPYWDSKFLVQSLRRDPNVSVASIVRLTPSRTLFDGPRDEGAKAQEPRDPGRPFEDRTFLDAHQVVILGRDVEAFLTPEGVANLRDWVGRQGGHLVCARGRPVGKRAREDDLLALLPVLWTEDEERRFRLELTERGRMAALFSSSRPDAAPAGPEEDPRVVLAALPSLVTASRVEKERALAVVLARGEGSGTVSDMATLSYQPYGAGRIVVLEGQGLWHWAFQPPDDSAPPESPPAAAAIFHAFWANTVRWLAGSNDFLPSERVNLRPGKSTYSIDESPVVYLLARAPPPGEKAPPEPVLEIDREDGDAALAGAGTFPIRVRPTPVQGDASIRRAVLDPLPEGRYRARLVDPSARPEDQAPPPDPAAAPATAAPEVTFEVEPPLQERLDLRARPELMRRIAERSDGEAIPPERVSRLSEHYGRYVARFRPDLEKREPAWDRPWVWAAIVAWLGLFWWIRRTWGLP
jgi:hypothetical protein